MSNKIIIIWLLLFCYSPVALAQSETLEMVYVEGGTFNMGCAKCGADAAPIHSVTVSNFSIGKYEIMQQQWNSVMGTNPSNHKECNNCPVENVSWDDVQEFLKKLNSLSPGKNYRLPTEAEWEFAATGGKKTHAYRYSGSNNLKEVACYRENSGNHTHPAGEKTPNELGIYDMSGNVREWCADWYDAGYYKQSPTLNPPGPSFGAFVVFRGGSWSDGPNNCLSTARFNEFSGERSSFTGFRIATSN